MLTVKILKCFHGIYDNWITSLISSAKRHILFLGHHRCRRRTPADKNNPARPSLPVWLPDLGQFHEYLAGQLNQQVLNVEHGDDVHDQLLLVSVHFYQSFLPRPDIRDNWIHPGSFNDQWAHTFAIGGQCDRPDLHIHHNSEIRSAGLHADHDHSSTASHSFFVDYFRT